MKFHGRPILSNCNLSLLLETFGQNKLAIYLNEVATDDLTLILKSSGTFFTLWIHFKNKEYTFYAIHIKLKRKISCQSLDIKHMYLIFSNSHQTGSLLSIKTKWLQDMEYKYVCLNYMLKENKWSVEYHCNVNEWSGLFLLLLLFILHQQGWLNIAKVNDIQLLLLNFRSLSLFPPRGWLEEEWVKN